MEGLTGFSPPQIQEKKETITFQDEIQETQLKNVDIVFDYDKKQETLFEVDDASSVNRVEDPPTDQIEANLQRIDSSIVSDQENILDKEQKLPISQRIDSLITKIQKLKSEHTILSEEVKAIFRGSFPGTDLSADFLSLATEHEALKKKYLEESTERKRLYNEVIELKGNIRVFCRCRPLRTEEIANSSSVFEFDPSQETELQIMCSDSSKKKFNFDHVFGPQDNQEAVFAQTSPIVTSVLDGFNVCIFAYGQTGTGKTFTMEGTAENRGVNYRTLEQLFRISEERNCTMKYSLFVSMLEVYNEKIRDLLVENSNQSTKKLEIKQVAEGTLEVPGLVEAEVFNTNEIWELLKAGSRSRAVGSTSANQLSSRSHCLLRVTVTGESLINGQRSKSHLWLVDLAGSERVSKIEMDGERLKESQCINKSLSALGDVISALASKNPHIPYRNSKLTHLLQSSLGGDCKTLMFVQISPNAADLGETLCSLNFASRVRGIEHGPARKQTDHLDTFKYKQMAEKLKQDEKESRKMQDSLQSLQLKFAAREQLCRNLQEKVRDLESQLADEKKARLQQENRAAAAAAAEDQKSRAEKRPPLFPSKLRTPLNTLYKNVLPPSIPGRMRAIPEATAGNKENMFISKPTLFTPATKGPMSRMRAIPEADNKENMLISKPTLVNPATIAPMRARRVSLVSSVQPKLMQPKRRVSIAVVQPQMHRLSTAFNNATQYSRPNNGTKARLSFARDPRRRSRIFSPLDESTVAATPVSKRSSIIPSSSSKFSSPVQFSWKSKHPIVASAQRGRFTTSPLNLRSLRNAQTLNKFCLSVQRKVGG